MIEISNIINNEFIDKYLEKCNYCEDKEEIMNFLYEYAKDKGIVSDVIDIKLAKVLLLINLNNYIVNKRKKFYL